MTNINELMQSNYESKIKCRRKKTHFFKKAYARKNYKNNVKFTIFFQKISYSGAEFLMRATRA